MIYFGAWAKKNLAIIVQENKGTLDYVFERTNAKTLIVTVGIRDYDSIKKSSSMKKARILITIKNDVLDPSGVAVKKVLTREGFSAVKNVRIGKVIDIELDDSVQRDPLPILTKFAETILSNPIMEDFTIIVDETSHEQ